MKPVKEEMAPGTSAVPQAAAQKVTEEARREIEAFLFREARVLDERDYDAWLDLLAPDIHYWMPVIENRRKDDPRGNYGPGRMAYFDDDLRYLKVRVKRLQASTAWSEDPPTRQVHVVTNIEVQPTDNPAEVLVHSILISYRNRGERDEGMQFARREDLLRLAEGTWLLARRKILLTQSVLLSRNINTFF